MALGEDARCFLAAFVECVTVQANPPAQYRLNVAEGFLAEARQKPGRPARGPVSENGAKSPVNKHCDAPIGEPTKMRIEGLIFAPMPPGGRGALS